MSSSLVLKVWSAQKAAAALARLRHKDGWKPGVHYGEPPGWGIVPIRSTMNGFDTHQTELEQLCRHYCVLRLDLFGSAATGDFRPQESDLDFLVEFEPLPPGAYADAYFGLLESLESLFGCPVDLVVGTAIKNPYLRQAVEQTKVLLYAA